MEEHSELKKRLVNIALTVIVGLGAGFAGGYFGVQSDFDGGSDASQQIAKSESQLTRQIAEEVGPSVVSINVTSRSVENSFFGPRAFTSKSAGTGFIISSDGIVVTNRHVIPEGTTDLGITLSDGTQLDKVEIIGKTNESDPIDVAFLKITDKKDKTLKAARLGDSSEVDVGEKVVAIGNALGQFQNTVTSGIISGYGREVEASGAEGTETLQNLFQTDAAINEGNSGGPLVNMDGEVIGINTAIAGGAEGIGFAIPLNDVKGLIDGALSEGKLLRTYLGVRYVAITDDFAASKKLSAKRGAYIIPSFPGEPSVLPGSPAKKAGLREGDIITKVDDTPIDEKNSLTSVIAQKKVGDKVKLTIVRGDKTIEVEVTLEAMPQ